MKSKISSAVYRILTTPVGIGHYLLTGGDPLIPLWMMRYDNFACQITGRPPTYDFKDHYSQWLIQNEQTKKR